MGAANVANLTPSLFLIVGFFGFFIFLFRLRLRAALTSSREMELAVVGLVWLVGFVAGVGWRCRSCWCALCPPSRCFQPCQGSRDDQASAGQGLTVSACRAHRNKNAIIVCSRGISFQATASRPSLLHDDIILSSVALRISRGMAISVPLPATLSPDRLLYRRAYRDIPRDLSLFAP